MADTQKNPNTIVQKWQDQIKEYAQLWEAQCAEQEINLLRAAHIPRLINKVLGNQEAQS